MNESEFQNGDFPQENLQDDGFKVGQEAPEQNESSYEEKQEPEKEVNVADSISKRLGQQATDDVQEESTAPKAQNTMPFNINELSREQLQSLKAMLNATPDGQSKKDRKPTVTIPEINGKIIVDHKKCIQGLVKHPDTQQDVMRPLIPVLFKGEKEYVNILYSEFINSNKITCEVIKHTFEPKTIVEGETISRETGRLVDQVRTEMISYFTVKLPNSDETLELLGHQIN